MIRKLFKNFIFYVFILCVLLNLQVFAHEEDEHHCDCCTCHTGTSQPKEIKDGTLLTIQDCISIGLKNSPVIKKRKYELDIAKSNVGLAKSAYFPTIGAGVGYGQINNSNSKYLQSLYRELPTVGVSLSKMIWDFGRTTANIKMEEFYKIGAEYEFMDSVCSTVFEIKMRYYDVLRAQSILEAKKLNYEINKNLISDIENMIKDGKTDRADLLNAQTQQLKIKNEVIEAEDFLKNSKENLNNAIYFVDAPEYRIQSTETYETEYPAECSPFILVSQIKPSKLKIKTSKTDVRLPDFSYSEAVELAYKNSPDLKVLVSTKNAMEQALLVIKRSYYPELNGSVGYNFINTREFSNNDLTIGVSLSSSLNAMAQKYSLKGAYAQIDLAQTEIDKFKKDLYFQVRKSLNTVNMTKEKIPVSRNQLKVSYENLERTISRYKENKMDQLELLNARQSYYESMEDYINSVYQYNIALINLEISMHYHLIDLHDRTEHAMKYHDQEIIDNFNNIMDCNKHDYKDKNHNKK